MWCSVQLFRLLRSWSPSVQPMPLSSSVFRLLRSWSPSVQPMPLSSSVFRLPSWSRSCNHSTVCSRFDEAEKCNFVPFYEFWRSVSVEERRLSLVYPWLMFGECCPEGIDEDGCYHNTRIFYSLSTQVHYGFMLPEARGKRCWSSKGWLITMGLDLEIHLLNPCSRVLIRLPPQPTLPHQIEYKNPDDDDIPKYLRQEFIHKVVLSSKPEEDNHHSVVVMAICSDIRKLAFLRLGDVDWKGMKCPEGINDVIYFNDQFYAVDSRGRLFICDISSCPPKVIKFMEPPSGVDEVKEYMYYIVGSLGKLFMVAREISLINNSEVDEDDEEEEEEDDDDDTVSRYKTVGFNVYMLDFNNKKWTKVNMLVNRALFLGNNESFAIFPQKELPGCEPNCIYFTDSYYKNLDDGAGHDIGVFRMLNQKIEPCYDGPYSPDLLSDYSTPLWICPPI